MPDTAAALPQLLTLEDLGDQLQCSAKTVRRRLAEAMQTDPGLRVVRRGRTLLFTPDQASRLIKALEWRSTSESAAKRGTHAGRSVLAVTQSHSAKSAQERVRELTRRPGLPTKPRGSEGPILQALPGGRVP